MFKAITAVLVTALFVTAGSSAMANGSQATIGVSLRIVDTCGVAQASGGVRIRCRSGQAPSANSSGSRVSPASVAQQWCRGIVSNSDSTESACLVTRAPGYDQQLVTVTF
jgi:hypothetical protein